MRKNRKERGENGERKKAKEGDEVGVRMKKKSQPCVKDIIENVKRSKE